MVTDTISILELVTFVLLLLGVVVTGRSLSLVTEDNNRVKRKIGFVNQGARHRLSKRNVRNEVGKFSTAILFLIAVGVLMTQPPVQGRAVTPGSLAVITAILWSLMVIVIDTTLYLRDRQVILDLLEESSRSGNVTTTTLVRGEPGKDQLIVPVNVVEKSG